MPTDRPANAARATYHHGDLRAALIAAGLTLLAERSLHDVSLREIARVVGVSATSVYRHFPDKAALIDALAAAGLDRLDRAQRDAADAAGPRDAFAATGRAYVRFALANPALFRIIFTTPRTLGPEGLPADDIAAFNLLRANAAAMVPGSDAAATRARTVQAWAIVHGLAMLMLDGQLPASEELIAAVLG